MLRIFARSIAALAPVAVLVSACSVATEPTTASESQDLAVKVCPMIAIMCVEGYKAKQTGGCNYVCVPDKSQSWECSVDAECPAIYCITTPCPQYQCRGHKCVMGNDVPSEPCGNATCGAGSYCCNSLCSICAPEGYGCIQGCAY
jgi:hypothetical protein